ncbi:MAG TPA: GNAT family N-acetyltransferase [Solirubrobacteraceae bacterium]|jgi:ribosomal protein S18 acetylase RimI-like enzyme|nr:GNAT family N-acetyltransferase [Solirubrobacteraceae bacterium]
MNNGHRPSEPVPIGVEELDCEVRTAEHADVPGLVAGVTELLLEIGGNPASSEPLEDAAHELIDDPEAGVLIVAESGDAIVGVLGASWQSAIRIPGRYGLIQELWVARAFRYREIGTELINELVALAQAQGIGRLEVGLPSERYPHLAATESFYETHLFKGIGLRMRRQL